MIEYLVSLSSTNKIRCIIISCSEEWDEEQAGFVIERWSFQYKGKRTQQPSKVIQHGKAKRTARQQMELEFNSLVKKQLDKGYKRVDADPDDFMEDELREVVGTNTTNQDGMVKPMLAKQADKVAEKVFDKEWYASRKVNGVRCLIYFQNGAIHTSSRGSINYDFAINHIVEHPKLIEFFKKHPDYILDGEIYRHGMTLNKISGICRSQKTAYDGIDLEFYLYDIVQLDKPFYQRYITLTDIQEELEIDDFNPYREYSEDDLKFQVLPHVEISGWDNIKKLHDEYVNEGWEGLVIRDVDGLYGPGKRSNAMLKVKNYIDAEYKIVGLSEGLREEDMCFVMETPNGQQFKAKPVGDRELKKYYREHIDEIIGKMGTLKYFEMSGKEGSEVPQQPIFLYVREEIL